MDSPPRYWTRNRLLSALTHDEWLMIGRDAELVTLPAGHVLWHSGDPITHAYFPCTGLIATFSVLGSGDQVATLVTGAEGMIGWGPIVGLDTASQASQIKVAFTGCRMPVAPLQQAFDDSTVFRRLILHSIGNTLRQVARSGVCNRFHTQRERVARWLVAITGKTGQMSMAITHDQLAQMVGGPRHAVSETIAEFRSLGILQNIRGSIELLDRDALATVACDCHRIDLHSVNAPPNG